MTIGSLGFISGALRRLEAHLPDIIHHAGSPEYDAARSVYFTGVDRHPAMVLRPRSVAQVAEVVRIVSGEGGRLTVKGGGHGFTSRGVADGIPALDLSALGGVSVDPDARLARAGGGVTTGAFTAKAAEHGLATGFGDSPEVGVAGITQAGGMGFLHRRLGLTVDSLVGAQVVTADGEIREVDEHRDPDLFWAIRGGGGGFGVVTRLDFRLHPVDQVVGGMLMAPTSPESFREALDLLTDAPNEVSGILQAMKAPPMPMVPTELHGRMLLFAFLVHSGTPEDGERWMERFRRMTNPVVDGLASLPYKALFEEHGGPPAPPLLRFRSAFREPLTVDEIRPLFERLEEPHTGVIRMLQLRPLGGAVTDHPSSVTAFAHREAPLLASAGAIFSDEEEAEDHTLWTRSMHRELTGGEERGAYAGFLGADDPEGPAAAWPEDHRERLLEVKERYDPARLFSAPVDDPSRGW